MSKRLTLGVFIVCLFVISPVLAVEMVVQNDSIVDPNQATLIVDFYPGEEVGVHLTSPTDGVIVAVQILWKGIFLLPRNRRQIM